MHLRCQLINSYHQSWKEKACRSEKACCDWPWEIKWHGREKDITYEKWKVFWAEEVMKGAIIVWIDYNSWCSFKPREQKNFLNCLKAPEGWLAHTEMWWLEGNHTYHIWVVGKQLKRLFLFFSHTVAFFLQRLLSVLKTASVMWKQFLFLHRKSHRKHWPVKGFQILFSGIFLQWFVHAAECNRAKTNGSNARNTRETFNLLKHASNRSSRGQDIIVVPSMSQDPKALGTTFTIMQFNSVFSIAPLCLLNT